MARIDIRDDIAFPQERVYMAFRDEMAKVAEHLPDIESITVDSYERTGDDTVSIVNQWKASATDIPRVARAFIKPEMLKWTDYATWHDDTNSCDWKLVLGFLPDAVSCEGTTTYTPDGERTRVHITGELKVDASKIPGVPRMLSSKIGSAVEEFVVKLVTPNLKATNRGIETFLRG